MEGGAQVGDINVTQIGKQVHMQAPPRKEAFLEGDGARLISEIKSHYKNKNEIEIVFAERGIPIEKGGYINLAIVKEEEQRKKEEEELNGEANKESKEDKALGKVFTDKRIRSFEDIYGTKIPIELKDIFFDGKSDKKGFNSALLLGRAGIGKSTVCQYIAYQWSAGKLWNNKFDLIVWIPLRNLLDKKKYRGDKINSNKVIYEECFSQKFKDDEEDNKFSPKIFAECFKKIPEDKILYILDGYDEVAHLGEDTAARKVISEIFLKKKHIILTSRPFYLKENPFSHDENGKFQRVETIGFSDKDIENYIKLFFKATDSQGKSDENNKREIYSDSLKQFLKDVPNAKGIAHIPINLALICQSWKEHHDEIRKIKSKNFTLSMLYQGLLLSLCIRYLNKHQPEAKIRLKIWDVICKKGRCPMILDALKELAFKKMVDKSKSLIIENDKVIEIINRNERLLDDLLNFGLLKPVNSYHVKKENQSYYFIHLTFQEFLAAYYIADRLKEIEDEKVIKNNNNDDNHKDEHKHKKIDIQKFIKSNKYQPRYEIVWWFVAGLLKGKEDQEARELFFEYLEDEESKDIAGLTHQCLLIRCFDECGEVENERFQERKEIFIAQLGVKIHSSIRERFLLSGMIKIIFNYLGISPHIFGHGALQSKLLELFENEDWMVRSYAQEVLGEQSSLPENILDKLVKLSEDKDKDKDVRRSAALALRRQSSLSEEILDKLVKLLEDEDYEVRDSAAAALSRQSSLSKEILDKLVKLLEDKDEDKDVRGYAAAVLGSQSSLSKEILDKLVKFLEDKDEDKDVRGYAVEALSRQSSLSKEILNKLVKFLEDKDKDKERVPNNFPNGGKITNSALQFFMGDGKKNPSHLEFNTWYDPDICHYLLQMSANRAQCIRVIFHDADCETKTNTKTFKDQIQNLIFLGNKLEKIAIFISKEPGANNHYICGIVKGSKLLLINPLGITNKKDCYQTLAELQKEGILGEIWLSNHPFQKHVFEEDGLVSCGAITVELATHILESFTQEQLNNFWSNQLKINEPTTVVVNENNLIYHGTSISPLLPETLNILLNVDKSTYCQRVCVIRKKHCEQLKTLPLQKANAVGTSEEKYLVHCKESSTAQVVFNLLMTEDKNTLSFEKSEEYQSLKEELSLSPVKKNPQKNSTTSESLGSYLGHVLKDVRGYSVEALGSQSSLSEILDKLVKLLEDKDEDKDVRGYAAAVLGSQSSLSKEILDKLVKLLDDEDKDVRRSAALALGRQSSLSEILDKLVKLLRNKNSEVRYYATAALRRQSSFPTNILDKLVKLLEDEDKDVRRSAALALGRQSSLSKEILEECEGVVDRRSLLHMIKNERVYLMEKIVLKSLSEKTPIYKDLENKKNIFVGDTKVQFETSDQRTQFIKNFQKELVKQTKVKPIQKRTSKVSEFFGGFFKSVKINEKEVVAEKDENTEDRDTCFVM